MADYIINDDWVLKRVTKDSSSFSNWTKGIIDYIQKSIDAKYPEHSDEFKESKKDLPDLVEMELTLEEGRKSLIKASEKIQVRQKKN